MSYCCMPVTMIVFVGLILSYVFTLCLICAGTVVVMLHVCYLRCTGERKLHENWWFKRVVIGLDISCE